MLFLLKGSMIRGIGTDIVEIDRISNAIKKEFFLKKAFNDSEIDMAVGRKKDSFLAGNFATKEAFVKALGTGFRGVELKDLAVLRDELGKPFIKICNKYQFYHIPKIYCIARLTAVIPIQQNAPVKIGLAPVLINFIILLFKPIAAIAIIIKNFESSLNTEKASAFTPK